MTLVSIQCIKVRPYGQKFSRTTWFNMVVRHKTWLPCCATKIVNRQMSVHFKKHSCDIMVSQRWCVLSDVIWTYFCHFLRCSHAKFIKKNRGCVNVSRTTTFCTTMTRFMSHNLVVQSCMTKLLSVWMHLKDLSAFRSKAVTCLHLAPFPALQEHQPCIR